MSVADSGRVVVVLNVGGFRLNLNVIPRHGRYREFLADLLEHIPRPSGPNCRCRPSGVHLLNEFLAVLLIVQRFRGKDNNEVQKDASIRREVQPKNPQQISWHVAGIVPPLNALVLDLWKTLSHPDHFLYIVLITNVNSDAVVS